MVGFTAKLHYTTLLQYISTPNYYTTLLHHATTPHNYTTLHYTILYRSAQLSPSETLSDPLSDPPLVERQKATGGGAGGVRELIPEYRELDNASLG